MKNFLIILASVFSMQAQAQSLRIIDCKLAGGFYGNFEVYKDAEKDILIEARQGFAYETTTKLGIDLAPEMGLRFKRSECKIETSEQSVHLKCYAENSKLFTVADDSNGPVYKEYNVLSANVILSTGTNSDSHTVFPAKIALQIEKPNGEIGTSIIKVLFSKQFNEPACLF